MINADTLRHERGHNWQLMMMGIAIYAFTVAIPSATQLGYWAKEKLYYHSPWESMEDALGGVQNHKYSIKEIVDLLSQILITKHINEVLIFRYILNKLVGFNYNDEYKSKKTHYYGECYDFGK